MDTEKRQDNELDELPSKPKLLLILFWEFAKVSTFVVGGGYVIFAAIEEVFTKKRRYLNSDDFLEMIGIAQTVPGILACNGAIYVGSRLAGIPGALVALVGTIISPVIIIIMIASIMTKIPTDNPHIAGALIGINSCIVGLLLATAIRTGQKLLVSPFEYFMAFGCLIGMVLLKLTPGYLILGSIPIGIVYTLAVQRKMKYQKPELEDESNVDI